MIFFIYIENGILCLLIRIANFGIIPILPFPNNPKDLDPSFKIDLDPRDCFGRKIIRLITEEIGYMSKDWKKMRLSDSH